MKRLFAIPVVLFLVACGVSKVEGTYSSNMTGVTEQKMSFTFKKDGTARMSIGGTALPMEMPYEVNGKTIKVTGQNGDIVFTVLDDGDLLTEGMRLKKEM
ncbi:hypothetical protein [Azospira inquinata]|uniref:Uncharacterized protein n=1 Tax=Azospira inquinata TaxID=2785627 RepID=A0A975SPY9_9RHOO|nr:hypothetical protein [Azospira inquinata]QWT46960.1 hypothetical protein J8L76_04430 [Azospira inquinata]QWT50409.1 hypothetical protein Azoinq_07440 [Azospira inquinata]